MKTDMEGGVKFCIKLNITAEEMATWSPERIASFFEGVAQVTRARGDVSLPGADDVSVPAADDGRAKPS